MLLWLNKWYLSDNSETLEPVQPSFHWQKRKNKDLSRQLNPLFTGRYGDWNVRLNSLMQAVFFLGSRPRKIGFRPWERRLKSRRRVTSNGMIGCKRLNYETLKEMILS